jgi:hypothetical protein
MARRYANWNAREKWDWKRIAKLSESKFLPKIEEIEAPTLCQSFAANNSKDFILLLLD